MWVGTGLWTPALGLQLWAAKFSFHVYLLNVAGQQSWVAARSWCYVHITTLVLRLQRQHDNWNPHKQVVFMHFCHCEKWTKQEAPQQLFTKKYRVTIKSHVKTSNAIWIIGSLAFEKRRHVLCPSRAHLPEVMSLGSVLLHQTVVV